MKLEYVPLLQIQRDLYQMPRGVERFREYLATMIDQQSRDLKLPLAAMNPMGKEHIPDLLDQLLALDTDSIATQIIAEAAPSLTYIPGEFKVAIVVADDLMGGWTNRYFAEFSRRFGSKPYHQRGWLEVGLWTSETPSIQTIREEVLITVYRAAHIQQHGFAGTLREMLRQERFAMISAGCTQLTFDQEELDYTQAVISDYLEAQDQPTLIACLYGDEVARSLGYKPLGLSTRAGFALAFYTSFA